MNSILRYYMGTPFYHEEDSFNKLLSNRKLVPWGREGRKGPEVQSSPAPKQDLTQEGTWSDQVEVAQAKP